MSRVVVLGSTASGKSDVAMEAARRVGRTHIVCADSMQVYRGMDIGTAKPTDADRAEVPHHCLDLVAPSERFTVALYAEELECARRGIEESHANELVVGGSGLYITAAVDGLTMPGEWPEIRAELEAEPDTAALWQRLYDRDPEATTKMEPSNRRRIIRALEVCLGSGEPFSSFGEGVATFPLVDTVQIGIMWDRNTLRARIETRVHQMMNAGLVEEVRTLLSAPGGMSATARQALGYKEVIEYLEGRWPLAHAVEAIILRTQQFAVRQERWFRRDPRIRWVEVQNDPIKEVTPVVISALA